MNTAIQKNCRFFLDLLYAGKIVFSPNNAMENH